MEYQFQFPSFPIIFTFLLFVFMILKIRKTSKASRSNLPPGPRKLPLIGNLHQLAGYLPHQRLSELAKKYGPFMYLQLGEVPHYVVSSPEIAKEVLKIHDISFADRPRLLVARFYDFTSIAFSPYGDYWRQLRKISTIELLSVKRVQSFRSIREQEISKVIGSIYSNAGKQINLTKMVYSLTNDITATAAFGGRCKDQEAFLQFAQKIIELGSGFSPADLFPSIKLLELFSGLSSKLEKCGQEGDKILNNIINEHKARRRTRKSSTSTDGEQEDLVDILLNIMDRGELEIPITIDNIKAVVMDLFLAGTETSSSTVVWAISEMLKNPRVLEKAQKEVRDVFGKKGNVDEDGLHELEYLKLVIKETLRLHAPVPLLLPRECRESREINGYNIPVGSRIIINAWRIGRDPKYWHKPESFDPDRFLNNSIDFKGTNFEFIPFGAGRRMCPGISFSKPNIELTLAHLLFHFNWKLPSGLKNEDLDMTESFGATVRMKDDLYLIPIPHHPPPSK